MKPGLKTEHTVLGIDENRPTRVAIMEIISVEDNIDAAFNALFESRFDEALTEIAEAEKSLQGARVAIARAQAEKIDRMNQN